MTLLADLLTARWHGPAARGPLPLSAPVALLAKRTFIAAFSDDLEGYGRRQQMVEVMFQELGAFG